MLHLRRFPEQRLHFAGESSPTLINQPSPKLPRQAFAAGVSLVGFREIDGGVSPRHDHM